MTMMGEIFTAVVDVALLVAFALILGAFAVLLWDLLQGRMRGWLRVLAVAVLAPACALAATVISAGAGLTLVSTLSPDEPPAHTEPAEKDSENTSPERKGSETTTERSASPSATPSSTTSASPTASPSATPSPSASPST
jgi:hypothetical protein